MLQKSQSRPDAMHERRHPDTYNIKILDGRACLPDIKFMASVVLNAVIEVVFKVVIDVNFPHISTAI